MINFKLSIIEFTQRDDLLCCGFPMQVDLMAAMHTALTSENSAALSVACAQS